MRAPKCKICGDEHYGMCPKFAGKPRTVGTAKRALEQRRTVAAAARKMKQGRTKR